MTALDLALEIRKLLYVPRTPGRQHQIKLLVEQLVTLLESEHPVHGLAIDFVQKVSRWCEQQPEPVSFSAAMTFGREALDLANALESESKGKTK